MVQRDNMKPSSAADQPSLNNDDELTVTDPVEPPSEAGVDSVGYSERGDGATQTGFDHARELAEKAKSQKGRLLKQRFVLEDVLGEGGMGLVYKARDLRKVEAEDRNPYIALKVLGQQFKKHPQAFVSLQQEAVKSQKLAHPNIVTVHDFDRDDDTIFMTMELLKGDALDALLKLEAPFSKEVAMRYFRDLCAGLEYAHKRDLVHSDFKPGNIFVTTGGTVKILDFGIARAANKNALSHDFDVADLGALTPAYATVEMVNREAPSFSDDIYALACVLYLMLSGEHPYQRKSAYDAQQAKLKPARPEGLNNREWQALSAALSTEKSKRPASIAQFRESMMPPAPRRGALKSVAAVVILALGAAAWLGYQQYEAQQAEAAAVNARLKAAEDCFFVQDYSCTIENTLVLKNLAPDNTEAQKLLQLAQNAQAKLERETTINSRLAEARECLNSGDFSCARVKLQEVLKSQPDHAEAKVLLEQSEQRSAQARVGTILARAEDCLDSANFSCVQQALTDAQAQGAVAADLYPVQRRLDNLLAEREQASKEQGAAIARLLSEAERCLQQGDHSCSETKLSEVLELDALNTRAIEMKQSIATARQQARFNQQTVARFLQEAERCLERKDYSCTIARSESALAIIPEHSPAQAMIRKAEAAQKKAKMNISIQ